MDLPALTLPLVPTLPPLGPEWPASPPVAQQVWGAPDGTGPGDRRQSVLLLPCHNEARDLEHTLRRLEQALTECYPPERAGRVRLVWIDDGSDDGTVPLLKDWLARRPHPVLRGCRWPAELIQYQQPHGLTVVLLHAWQRLLREPIGRIGRIARMDPSGEDDHTQVLAPLLTQPLAAQSVRVVERERDPAGPAISPGTGGVRTSEILARHACETLIRERAPDWPYRPWLQAGQVWRPEALAMALTAIPVLDYPHEWGLEWAVLLGARRCSRVAITQATVSGPARRRASAMSPVRRLAPFAAWNEAIRRWLS